MQLHCLKVIEAGTRIWKVQKDMGLMEADMTSIDRNHT